MADSEVRQKFEAAERKRILDIWTQEIVEQMRHNFQGHHIPHSAVRLWLDRIWDEAYSAGMRFPPRQRRRTTVAAIKETN